MINSNLSEKIFDAMLEAACDEISEERAAAFEASYVEAHTFSARHVKRMRSLLKAHSRKAKNRSVGKTLRRIVAILIIVMALGFTFTMSVSALRTYVLNTFMEIGEEYFGFLFGDTNESKEIPNFPSYVPEGFSDETMQVSDLVAKALYIDSKGNSVWYFRVPKESGTNVRIDSDIDSSYTKTEINGIAISVHDGFHNGEPCHIYWEMNDFFFEIVGDTPSEELVRMAESVITDNR